MATESFELKYFDWLGKVTEKLTFIRLKVADGKDITEDDYALLEALHPIHFYGAYPIYATRISGTEEKAVQQGLFHDILAENKNGTEIEIPTSEPKTKKDVKKEIQS